MTPTAEWVKKTFVNYKTTIFHEEHSDSIANKHSSLSELSFSYNWGHFSRDETLFQNATLEVLHAYMRHATA